MVNSYVLLGSGRWSPRAQRVLITTTNSGGTTWANIFDGGTPDLGNPSLIDGGGTPIPSGFYDGNLYGNAGGIAGDLIVGDGLAVDVYDAGTPPTTGATLYDGDPAPVIAPPTPIPTTWIDALGATNFIDALGATDFIDGRST